MTGLYPTSLQLRKFPFYMIFIESDRLSTTKLLKPDTTCHESLVISYTRCPARGRAAGGGCWYPNPDHIRGHLLCVPTGAAPRPATRVSMKTVKLRTRFNAAIYGPPRTTPALLDRQIDSRAVDGTSYFHNAKRRSH